VGRGVTRGKTSGRGHKGQKARAGNSMRPQIRDYVKAIPKKRGYKFNPVSTPAVPVNLGTLERTFAGGETIDPKTLIANGVVEKESGRVPPIKILGNGELTKQLTVTGCHVSASARAKIEQAGGQVTD
jgi:large subunit ribosomal protein L15